MIVRSEGTLCPERPARQAEIELHRSPDDTRIVILKDRAKCRYHRVSLFSAKVWALCDGTRTVPEIGEALRTAGSASEHGAVATALRHLSSMEVLQRPHCSSASHDHAVVRTLKRRGLQAFNWRVTLRRVDAAMGALYRYAGHLAFSKVARWFAVLVILSGFAAFMVGLLGGTHSIAASARYWKFTCPALIAALLLHEFAHAMTTKHYGREVLAIGFGWFWFGPFCYVDTSDIWLGTRRQRILVSCAGPLCDLAIAGSLAILSMTINGICGEIAFAIAAALYVSVLYEMSPLLEYDGYYALSDYLGIANLRAKSTAHILRSLHDLPNSLRLLSADPVATIYGIASVAYLIVMIFIAGPTTHIVFETWLMPFASLHASTLAWTLTIILQIGFLVALYANLDQKVRTLARYRPGEAL